MLAKSRRSQISALLAALLAGFAALVALAGVGSHNVQQQLAQVTEPWGGPLHPITIDLKSVPQSLLPPGQSRKKEIDAIGTLNAYSFITRRPTDLYIDTNRL